MAPSSTSVTNVPDVKLGDFGFAKMLPKTSLAMSVLGSPIYMAPEVLKREPYNYKADLWSLGVVLYELMTGHTLFQSTNMENLRTTVDDYKDDIPFEKSKHEYSTELKDLVRVLLKRCPEERASCEEFCHYVKLIAQKDQRFDIAKISLIDSDEFQRIEDEYIVIECEPPPSSSIIASTPPLIPNIQRSHSVDYYQKRPIPAVRDRRHSAGSNGSILTRAISMTPFNLFGAHNRTTAEKAPASSSLSSTIAEEPIAEDEDIVKYLSGNIYYHTTLDVRLFTITSSLIKLFNDLFQPNKIYSSGQIPHDAPIALIRKIVHILTKATTVNNKFKYTNAENDLLRWGKAELNKFTMKQSNFEQKEVDQRIIQRLLYDNAVEMV